MAEQQELAPKGAKPKKEPAWGEGKILAALRERYAAPAFALFPHVRNRTGYGNVTRTADAIVMSLFPSRGLHISGIEIKSSRGDFLRELAEPDKAEEIARHCDYWILAIGDRDIVRTGELPATWGLLAPAAGKLKMVAEPKPLGERGDVPRPFLAALLRRAMEDSPGEEAIRGAVAAARDEWQKASAERKTRESTYELQVAQQHLADLRRRVVEFEAASGIDVSAGWHVKIGEAARALVHCPDTDHLAAGLEAGARTLASAAAEIRKLRAER